MQRQAILEKDKKVREIRNLTSKYEGMAIADLHKVRAAQLQVLRRKLEQKACLLVIKNSLMDRVLSSTNKRSNLENMKNYLKGSNLFLFSNLNPFKLVLLLESNKVFAYAKARDTASQDVVVPAGNTGQVPGPIISQLGSVGIPTRIESGSVWINRDTVVAKKGERISQSLAPVLSKLGIKSVELGLSLKAFYDNGIIIPKDQLSIDLDEYKNNIGAAYLEALNLSISTAFPITENIISLLSIGVLEAQTLVIKFAIPTPETIRNLLIKAYLEAATLNSKVSV